MCTDLQLLNSEQLRSPDALLQAIARTISEQLGLSPEPPSLWNPEDGANMNFRRFMRKTIQSSAAPLVWALDDVDRLFTCPFGLEIFALLRAWHNERALDPHGPWSNLTLVIAYASEAHLFIRDVNQSPFNVGTRLVLHDFTLDQVRHLNRLYGRPLRDAGEVLRFHSLVGGHPYLVRRGFLEMASRSLGLAALEARADAEDWIYGDHLRRIYAGLIQDPELCDGVREVLRGRSFPSPAAFYRLRSAGLLWGDAAEQSRLRCQLYSRYLARYLIPRSPSSRE